MDTKDTMLFLFGFEKSGLVSIVFFVVASRRESARSLD